MVGVVQARVGVGKVGWGTEWQYGVYWGCGWHRRIRVGKVS